MIFFSAHGVPVSYVEDAGDPYKDQMEECIDLIMQELKARGIDNKHTLAYQVGYQTLACVNFCSFAFSRNFGGWRLMLYLHPFILTTLTFFFSIRAELVLYNGWSPTPMKFLLN